MKADSPALVRDGYTIPAAEHAVLVSLKQRSALLGQPAKKSELLRAGVALLATLDDAAFAAALAAVPALKTGRPKKLARPEKHGKKAKAPVTPAAPPPAAPAGAKRLATGSSRTPPAARRRAPAGR
jgi:hypothetical protein